MEILLPRKNYASEIVSTHGQALLPEHSLRAKPLGFNALFISGVPNEKQRQCSHINNSRRSSVNHETTHNKEIGIIKLKQTMLNNSGTEYWSTS